METKKIYRFYVDNKLKASCGKNRKEEVFNDLSQKYGIEKVCMKEEYFKIDESLQYLMNELRNMRLKK